MRVQELADPVACGCRKVKSKAMIDLPLLVSILTPMREWFQFVKNNNQHNDEDYKEALTALYTAL